MKFQVPLALVAALSLAAPVATAADPVEGKDYFRINPAVPTSDATKIVVTEYFSYQCPHCYTFAKPFAAWSARLPQDAKADRAAVSIGHASWIAAGQAFYALTAMKAVPGIDDAFFGAIHRERKNLSDEASNCRAGLPGKASIASHSRKSTARSASSSRPSAPKTSLARCAYPACRRSSSTADIVVPIADDGDFRDQFALVDGLIARARRERAAAKPVSP